MTPAQQHAAASIAWQHSHPLLMVLFSTIGTLVVISLIVLIRWLVSRRAWRYHPAGAGGFLKDEAVRWGAILMPWLVLATAFKIFVYDLHPEYNRPDVWGVFIAVAIAFRLMLRRLPVIKAMGRHIDFARAQEKAARQGAIR